MVTRKMAALVFGNSAYPDGDELKNPVNDATDLGSKLKAYGFERGGRSHCSSQRLCLREGDGAAR